MGFVEPTKFTLVTLDSGDHAHELADDAML
jgi:hypothetical protein